MNLLSTWVRGKSAQRLPRSWGWVLNALSEKGSGRCQELGSDVTGGFENPPIRLASRKILAPANARASATRQPSNDHAVFRRESREQLPPPSSAHHLISD